MLLPDEMWEEILKNLDIFELIRLRTVSKSWHDMVNRVINRTCKWYEKCLQEIPKEYWTSILEYQNHPDLSYDDFNKSKMHSHVWSSMYKSWRGWNNLTKKTTRVRTIDIFPNTPDHNERTEPISLSASGNIIAICTGHHRLDGVLIVYDISEISEEPIFRHVQPGIQDVRVFRKDKDVTVVSTGPGKVQFWDARSKKIIQEYNDLSGTALISESLGHCYVLIHDWNQVESPDTEDLTWNMEKLSCGIDLRIIRRRKRFQDETVHAMVADADKVRLLLGTSTYTRMKVYEISPDSKKLKELSDNFIDLLDDGIYIINMFRPCVLLSADSEEDMIRASVAGRQWNICGVDCFRSDGCNWNSITAFLYHAGFLILGLFSGEIAIIRVENVNNFETFGWDKMEYMVVKLGDDPRDYGRVEHLAVTEYNSVQYLIAISNAKLHIIEFH